MVHRFQAKGLCWKKPFGICRMHHGVLESCFKFKSQVIHVNYTFKKTTTATVFIYPNSRKTYPDIAQELRQFCTLHHRSLGWTFIKNKALRSLSKDSGPTHYLRIKWLLHHAVIFPSSLSALSSATSQPVIWNLQHPKHASTRVIKRFRSLHRHCRCR